MENIASFVVKVADPFQISDWKLILTRHLWKLLDVRTLHSASPAIGYGKLLSKNTAHCIWLNFHTVCVRLFLALMAPKTALHSWTTDMTMLIFNYCNLYICIAHHMPYASRINNLLPLRWSNNTSHLIRNLINIWFMTACESGPDPNFMVTASTQSWRKGVT